MASFAAVSRVKGPLKSHRFCGAKTGGMLHKYKTSDFRDKSKTHLNLTRCIMTCTETAGYSSLNTAFVALVNQDIEAFRCTMNAPDLNGRVTKQRCCNALPLILRVYSIGKIAELGVGIESAESNALPIL